MDKSLHNLFLRFTGYLCSFKFGWNLISSKKFFHTLKFPVCSLSIYSITLFTRKFHFLPLSFFTIFFLSYYHHEGAKISIFTICTRSCGSSHKTHNTHKIWCLKIHIRSSKSSQEGKVCMIKSNMNIRRDGKSSFFAGEDFRDLKREVLSAHKRF